MEKMFGLCFQGSKSKLAEKIVALFPPATHIYDVFAGGCAVTHAALLSGKFEHVHANDITDSVKLFEDALNGNIAKYEPERFRSREDFFAEKDTNPYVRLTYSFGNNQRTYLYGRNIEPYKKAVHEMLYAPTPNKRRLKFRAVIREMEKLGFISTPPEKEPQSTSATAARRSDNEVKRDWTGQYGRLETIEREEQIKGINEHNEF